MNGVLVDAGPLYALVDPDDGNHRQARRQLELLAVSGARFFVVEPTVLETYSLILRKLGLRVALRWLRESQGFLEPLNPTSRDYRRAAKLVAGFPDQSITLFDAVLAILADEVGLPVWTYDFHFDVMCVTVWRGPGTI